MKPVYEDRSREKRKAVFIKKDSFCPNKGTEVSRNYFLPLFIYFTWVKCDKEHESFGMDSSPVPFLNKILTGDVHESNTTTNKSCLHRESSSVLIMFSLRALQSYHLNSAFLLRSPNLTPISLGSVSLFLKLLG